MILLINSPPSGYGQVWSKCTEYRAGMNTVHKLIDLSAKNCTRVSPRFKTQMESDKDDYFFSIPYESSTSRVLIKNTKGKLFKSTGG